MNEIWEILKYILPAGIVFATSYYMLKTFLDNQYKRELMETRAQHQKVITPIRLQAFERIALLLERLHPASLVMRIHKSGMTGRGLQAELLKAIRSEFDHNLSQQIYISPATWESIRSSKEETIKIINLASARINDQASGLDLSKSILDIVGQLEKVPTQVALENLKRELKQIF